jgi:hypothetical protein
MSAGIRYILQQLTTEQSIQNTESNSLLARSAGKQAEMSDEEKNMMRESAEGMRQAMAVIGIVSSAANTAKSVQGAGDAVHDYAEMKQTEPQMKSALDSGGEAQLSHVKLGSDGPTVGERWGGKRLDMLTHPDQLHDQLVMNKDGSIDTEASVKNLEKQGFSESEAKDLVKAQEKGPLSEDQAIDFMWSHRKTDAQQHHAQQRDKMIQGIIGQTTEGVSRDLGLAAKMYQDRGKRFGEGNAKARDLEDSLGKTMIDSNRKLGQISLDALKGQSQAGGGGSSKR